MTDQPNADVNNNDDLLLLTADLVAAYVSRNPVPVTELSSLIGKVHSALSNLSSPQPSNEQELIPAVPIKKSVTHDHVVCLEDGRKFKSLRRHLRSEHGMLPEQYRAKWGLPASYPMVAPGYAAERSELAKQIGLGRKTSAKSRKKRVSA